MLHPALWAINLDCNPLFSLVVLNSCIALISTLDSGHIFGDTIFFSDMLFQKNFAGYLSGGVTSAP